MKRVSLLLSVLFIVATASFSQELGIRFGNVTGGHVAIDGILSLGEFSKVHADVSFYSGGVGVEALWDFLYRPLGDAPLNWYVGAGPFIWIQDPFGFGVAGEVGLDYHFDFPLSLSADWRPSF